jgi:hypothetical protein
VSVKENAATLNFKRWNFRLVALGGYFYAIGGQTDSDIIKQLR